MCERTDEIVRRRAARVSVKVKEIHLRPMHRK